jgi:indolepyruvate ferredoxin oxidoreductase
MIGTGAKQPDLSSMIAALDSRSRRDVSLYVDMAAVVQDLFGSTTTANIFGLGLAYQLGALPVSAAVIEQAITLNGVAVRANIRAFRWGRLYVAERPQVDAARAIAAKGRTGRAAAAPKGNLGAVTSLGGTAFGGELGRLVASRAADLVSYQNRGYAERYVSDVTAVAEAEAAVKPGSTALAEAVARYYYKLLAYKDEYEVARLHLADEAQASIDAVTRGEPVKVVWLLHPPILRAMGMKHKLRLGPWFRPAFVTLRAMRGLRGTAFDPFGPARVRRAERQLIDQYRAWLQTLPGTLTAASHAIAVEIASAPDMVRGYENIKLGNVEQYERSRDALLARYQEADAPGISSAS